MRQLLRYVSITALACVTFAPAPASAAQAGATQPDNCRQSALQQLRASAPDGFSVYKKMKDKDFFDNWLSCDDVQFGLATAVHESVHYLTADDDAFPLVNGGAIKRPHEVSRFFAPSHIAKKFGSSIFAQTYLRPGKSSSATDFLYLLDELNAYTHDLNASMDLEHAHHATEEADSRDGLAAAMAFVAVYTQTAEESEPATWSGLQQPEVAATVSELWGRAEKVMKASCGIPNFGAEDKTFIRQFCQAKAQSSLETILGRAPVCPTECLKPTPVADQADQADQTDEKIVETTASVRPKPPLQLSSARPFWRGAGRHIAPLGDPEIDQSTAAH